MKNSAGEVVDSAEQTAVVAAEDNAAKGKPKAAEPTETPLEALASICTVLVIGLFVFAFVSQNFEIPSGSMKNTLLVGDHVAVDRVTLAPPTKWAPFVHYRPVQHGDIIVFMKPVGRDPIPDLILVKRAIGLPGDHIHLSHGTVFINGVAQKEPYALQPDSAPDRPYVHYRDDFPADVENIAGEASANGAAIWGVELPSHLENGDIVVPPHTVFAMGDNRTQSLDSRFWGFVPEENIMGRPMFVYWSFKTPEDQEDKTGMGDRIGFIFHIVLHIFDGTRWGRTLHIVR